MGLGWLGNRNGNTYLSHLSSILLPEEWLEEEKDIKINMSLPASGFLFITICFTHFSVSRSWISTPWTNRSVCGTFEWKGSVEWRWWWRWCLSHRWTLRQSQWRGQRDDKKCHWCRMKCRKITICHTFMRIGHKSVLRQIKFFLFTLTGPLFAVINWNNFILFLFINVISHFKFITAQRNPIEPRPAGRNGNVMSRCRRRGWGVSREFGSPTTGTEEELYDYERQVESQMRS